MNEIELGIAPFVFIAVISVAYGVACTLLARRFAHHDANRRASRRFLAHLLEFRLFMDDPVLLLRSQRDLIAAYFSLLRALARPAAAVVVVSAPVLFILQNWFARAPLPLDRAAVVTVHLQRMSDVALTAPPEVRIDTEGVRIPAVHEVSWRVTPISAVNEALVVKGASERIEHRIVAGNSFFAPYFERTSRVEINYPQATILGESWIAWFLVFSCSGSVLALMLCRLIA